jgi:hypothetical protein
MAEGHDRADPSAVPLVHDVSQLELSMVDQARATAAACRLRDRDRAVHLARRLRGEPWAHLAALCAGQGIDLPRP